MSRKGSSIAIASFAIGFLPGALQSQSRPRCEQPNAQISLDHVVVAVTHLDSASSTFRQLGFTIKEGRLHPNGILNRFVEFSDGTELELLALEAGPSDATSRGYEAFLRDGEGGAFLALRGVPSSVQDAASSAGLRTARTDGASYQYVTFPDPGFGALFFIEYTSSPAVPALGTHPNGATGLYQVVVEAPVAFGALLAALGALACPPLALPDGSVGTAYGVSKGTVVLVPPRGPRPRVVGVVVEIERAVREREFLDGRHGIWLQLGGPQPRF